MIKFLPFLLFSLTLRSSLTLVFLAFNFVPYIRRRLKFERKNFFDDQGLGVEFSSACFLVSSEGEFEQVLPLLEEYIKDAKKIEIVFTSDSVEKKIIRFALEHSGLVFYKRLPLMSFFPIPFLYFQSPWFFIKANVIFFCRYDFYPELLSMGLFSKKLILLSGTLKNKKSDGIKKIIYRYFFSLFDKIYVTSTYDLERFKMVATESKLELFDFRISRVLNRKEHASAKFHNIGIDNFLQFMQVDQTKRLIVGSGWESDLHLFNEITVKEFLKQEQIALYFFPHKIKDEKLKQIVREVFFDNCIFISGLDELKQTKFESGHKVYFFDVAGILVEAYQFFSVCYIGGGFERSIHSVLEPYISGSDIICGPRIHRSTEWDLINGDQNDPGGLVVSSASELKDALARRFLCVTNIKPSKNRLELLKWNDNQVRKHYLKFQAFLKM